MQCVEADARLMAPKPCIERLTHRNIQMIPYVICFDDVPVCCHWSGWWRDCVRKKCHKMPSNPSLTFAFVKVSRDIPFTVLWQQYRMQMVSRWDNEMRVRIVSAG